jgi:hypothetical protein
VAEINGVGIEQETKVGFLPAREVVPAVDVGRRRLVAESGRQPRRATLARRGDAIGDGLPGMPTRALQGWSQIGESAVENCIFESCAILSKPPLITGIARIARAGVRHFPCTRGKTVP